MQAEVNREAFAKSVPIAAVNSKQVKPKPIKIDAGELLALKALAKTFMKLYDESKKT